MGDSGFAIPTERWRRRLYLPAYPVAEAAKLVEAHPRTVSRWYYGYRLPSGAHAARVLGERERGEALSYLQLVEVAFVATLRKIGVSLERLRLAHDYLARRFEAEYPFAQLRLKTDGAHVMMDLEESEGAWVKRLVVVSAQGQVAWAEPMEERIRQFEYDVKRGLAIRWFPRGERAPVVVDPQVAFGAPVLRDTAISTAAIKGRFRSGEDVTEISEDFGLGPDMVRYALEFEGELPLAA